jgi:enoyl-CoA hydratase
MSKSYQNLSLAVEGQIATMTLTRPEILNAMDDVTHEELVDVIERMRRPADIRCLIMASTGPAFSAGGDINEIHRLTEDRVRRDTAWDMGRRLIYGMLEIPIPVVMALQGDVYGVATSMVLCGDAIIASKNVRLGDPHVKVGLVAGDGGCFVWPAAFGMVRAKRHILTGEPIGAEEAYRLGGVSDLVESPEDVLPLAQEIAGKIARLPPIAVQFTKRAFNHAMYKQALDVFELSMALEQYGMTSEDLIEAVTSFQEKRKPAYQNR